jgi:metacaspase-1
MSKGPFQALSRAPLLGTGAASRAGQKRALVVGINAYPHQPLRGCINDVADVVSFLRDERGFSPSHIRQLCDGQATREAILRELHELAAASQRGDVMVFYFCGHGAQLPTDDPSELDGLDEVLCPVDFAWTAATAVVDNQLEAIFDSIADGVDATWIFDACHTGDIDEQLDHRIDACRAMISPTPGAADAVASIGLCRMLARHRGVILSACASAEKAADIFVEDQPRGAFSYYLLKAARALRTATAAEVLAAAATELSEIGQHPEGYGPGLGAPFLRPGGSVSSTTSRLPSRLPSTTKHNDDQPRSVAVASSTSPDADRHLHMYLGEASRLVHTDQEFGARMTRLGVDLSSISPSDAAALSRAVKGSARLGGLACRTFWWGFHLEMPHAEIEALAATGIDELSLVRMLEVVPRAVAPHVGSLVEYVVATFEHIKTLNRGAGVFVSMSSFAPDLYVVTAVPSRTVVGRRLDRDSSDICAVRM